MSGRYVSRVLESDLDPTLKLTACALASFADDADGRRVRPSMDRVAWMVGLAVRSVQYHVKDLRKMHILTELEPATQWRPAHYQMHLDKLPWRAPYEPPSKQRSLLDPPGESPGVQPVAPQPGVQFEACLAPPGVQPVAPDPSSGDPSVHTRTDARACEAAGVQPDAPLHPRLPIPQFVRAPGHEAHAWCGRICVPKFLHREFKRAFGGPVKWRPKKMRAFYIETLAALPADQPVGEEPVKFWRRAFAARHSNRVVHASPAVPRFDSQGDDAWSQILRQLKSTVNSDAFHTWFVTASLVDVRGDVIEVRAASSRHARWIDDHYRAELAAAVASVRPGARVEFISTEAERKSG